MSITTRIEVEHVAKRYRIGVSHEHGSLREQLTAFIKRPFQRGGSDDEWIWALRDISFAVPEGEVVGILGRNGAGKSTLLKILSNITHPSSGRINIRGRIASLLEVGTGFHEELTGRENIYLNGSILGMRRREIDKHFAAIVEFSGVEQFLDTPIKRYSSGMRLRLGFAVAAHLEPDILVVDEVLAVGDAAFQKKCITAMEELRGGGRTVLFVSHNMAAVENLCSRGIWIDAGLVRMDADARDVIKAYLGSYAGEEVSGPGLNFDSRSGNGDIRFTRVEYLTLDGHPLAAPRSGDAFVMRVHYDVKQLVRHPSFGYRLFSSMGTLISDTSGKMHGISITMLKPGPGYIEITIESLPLVAGRYSLSFWVTGDSGVPVYDGDVRASLDVEPADVHGYGRLVDNRHGIVFLPQRWAVTESLDTTAVA